MKMNIRCKVSIWLAILVVTLMVAGPARADRPVRVTVKTVHASQREQFHDPRLSGLIAELQSVFRYTSYRLLGQDRLTLTRQQTGTVQLPGRRKLRITPQNIEENRAELRLVLSRKRRVIFQTTTRILNGGSITVGGPKYKDGYLLFNISNSF